MGNKGWVIGGRCSSALFFLFFVAHFPLRAQSQTVPALDTKRVLAGLTSPVFVTAPPGDYGRLFIVQQTGEIRILNLATGVLNGAPFVTIPNLATGNEQGLLGLAFDPNYTSNGRFYVCYVAAATGAIHVDQYRVSGNPDLADTSPANIKSVITFSHPQTNHNAGWIGFSPRSGDENNLYISSGDGGNANDADGGAGHIEPTGNAQNNTTVLGKMLRIHIDSATGMYSIPSSNPFFGAAAGVRQEIWTLGLRNPYRDSFDRLTGRMFIGDVGQSAREEIDVQQPTNPGGGENYGWRLREGTILTPGGVGGPPPAGNVEPIYDYARTGALGGRTVVGGYVYRGKQIPGLMGVYLFADYLGTAGSGPGKIFTLNYDGNAASNVQDITTQLFPTIGSPAVNLANPSSFGEDANGEVYITDIGNGNLYKILPTTPHVRVDSLTRDGTGPVVLRGLGVPFSTVTIQAASDPNAASFALLTTVPVLGDGTFEFTDSAGAGDPARFYRVVYP